VRGEPLSAPPARTREREREPLDLPTLRRAPGEIGEEPELGELERDLEDPAALATDRLAARPLDPR
jgi:hypothetical protein